MKIFALAAVLSAATALGAFAIPASADDAVPCEDMLKDLRAKVDAAKLAAEDLAKVTELEDKGIERCNADDDTRADAFFADALKILGK